MENSFSRAKLSKIKIATNEYIPLSSKHSSEISGNLNYDISGTL